jgi:hypothetical protein
MPFAEGGARDGSEPPPDDGSTARARSARGRAAHDRRRRRGASRSRQGGQQRGIRSCQPGRLPERRQQARVPDGERERGWRDLQCEELERCDGVLGPDRREPRLVEQRLPQCLRARLHTRQCGQQLHNLGDRADRGLVSRFSRRHRCEPVRRRDLQRPRLLPGPAGRPRGRPWTAPDGRRAPQRRERDDLHDPAREQERRVQR